MLGLGDRPRPRSRSSARRRQRFQQQPCIEAVQEGGGAVAQPGDQQRIGVDRRRRLAILLRIWMGWSATQASCLRCSGQGHMDISARRGSSSDASGDSSPSVIGKCHSLVLDTWELCSAILHSHLHYQSDHTCRRCCRARVSPPAGRTPSAAAAPRREARCSAAPRRAGASEDGPGGAACRQLRCGAAAWTSRLTSLALAPAHPHQHRGPVPAASCRGACRMHA